MQPRSIHLAFSKYSPEKFMMLLPGWRWGQRWGKETITGVDLSAPASLQVWSLQKNPLSFQLKSLKLGTVQRGERVTFSKEAHPKRDPGRQGWETARAKGSRCSFCTVYGLLRKKERKLIPFTSGLVRGDPPVLTEERANPVSGTNLHSQESTGKIKGSLTFKQGSQQDSQTVLVQI